MKNNNNKKIIITKHAFDRVNERAKRFGSDKGFYWYLVKHNFELFGTLALTNYKKTKSKKAKNHVVKCRYKKENLELAVAVNTKEIIIVTVMLSKIQYGNVLPHKEKNKLSYEKKKKNTLSAQHYKEKYIDHDEDIYWDDDYDDDYEGGFYAKE